jgi:hypothetical protein
MRVPDREIEAVRDLVGVRQLSCVDSPGAGPSAATGAVGPGAASDVWSGTVGERRPRHRQEI